MSKKKPKRHFSPSIWDSPLQITGDSAVLWTGCDWMYPSQTRNYTIHTGNLLTRSSLSTAVTVTMVVPTGDWSPTLRLKRSVLVKNGAVLRVTLTIIVAVAVRGVVLLSRAVTYSCKEIYFCARSNGSDFSFLGKNKLSCTHVLMIKIVLCLLSQPKLPGVFLQKV